MKIGLEVLFFGLEGVEVRVLRVVDRMLFFHQLQLELTVLIYNNNLTMAEELEPHILRKYDILQKLGKGAYGVVYKAQDKRSKALLAIKKVFDAFHNATDAQRTYREVVFLQGLGCHENIIGLHGTIKAQNNKDLYLVFDFMETDLHAVIRAGIMEDIHRRWVIYQTLKALLYIHSGDIIHRDLKPSNLLLDQRCNTKVADFGLARSVSVQFNENDPVLTEYVATRWYRSPEILLGSTKYTKAVDMWSVGCILGEMILGKPIFPGNSTLNQIQRILQLLGPPRPQDIASMQSQYATKILMGISQSKRKTFKQFFVSATDDAIDLLKKLLVFNPAQRLSAMQALSHPYLSEFRDIRSETTCQSPVRIQINDNKKFSIKEYRQALYDQITKNRRKEEKIVRDRSKQNFQRGKTAQTQYALLKERVQRQRMDRSRAERVERERQLSKEKDRAKERQKLKEIERQLEKQRNKILRSSVNYFSKKEQPRRDKRILSSNPEPKVKPVTASGGRPSCNQLDTSLLSIYQSNKRNNSQSQSQKRRQFR